MKNNNSTDSSEKRDYVPSAEDIIGVINSHYNEDNIKS
jgi:hypothetical protein